jgi:glycosyltransferase involved in cell wall biosynthesis
MTDEARRQSVCLTMIVRDEAHIVGEVLDATAPYIDYWVVVDTGSTDGTQDLIRSHMQRLAIPGELHERPWRDFGSNRSEALTLAQGKADYLWMMDADDTVIGVPPFGGLTADCYAMEIREDTGHIIWRRQLFRDGVPWFYRGVVHEYACCDEPFTAENLQGDYHIHGRRLGARNKDPDKYAKDAAVLLDYVGAHPDDEGAVFYLAQSYYDGGNFENARDWYARRVEMVDCAEEVFYSLLRRARSLAELNAPGTQVEDAYARAWAYRPTRAEPLYELAYRMRVSGRYELGYLFARQATAMSLPVENWIFVDTDVYTWRALDEQAVCASWIGRQQETFELCRRLLTIPGIDEQDRARFAANRDLAVPHLLEETATYPEDLARRPPGPPDAEVTFTLVAGPDRQQSERTLNSFLHCCTDIDKVGRFLALNVGLSAADRAQLSDLYPFLEFLTGSDEITPAEQTDQLAGAIGGRYWLHSGQGWQYFATEPLITRLCSILHAEPDVFQVGINYRDATTLTGVAAPAETTRTNTGTGRYVLTDTESNSGTHGPNMIDIDRFRTRSSDNRFTGATLDEVLCISVS